jgi:putative ABC transport system permease protein
VLGVVVGIFSIIVIMTIITMLQNSIEDGLSLLNKNTFQIEKFDRTQGRGPGSDRSWRKDITYDEARRLKELLTEAKYVGAEQWRMGRVIKYGNRETNPNISLSGQTLDGIKTNNWKVAYGRDLRDADIKNSNNVTILGQDVVDKLFPNMNPIGQTVTLNPNLQCLVIAGIIMLSYPLLPGKRCMENIMIASI